MATVTLTLRIDTNMHDTLTKLAEAKRQPVSSLVRNIIRDELERKLTPEAIDADMNERRQRLNELSDALNEAAKTTE